MSGQLAGQLPGQPDPAPGDAGVCTAIALGWQVAELFHAPVHRGPAAAPELTDRLPGRSDFPGATQALWLGEQIQTQVLALFPALPGESPLAVQLADVLAVLRDPGRRREVAREAIFGLHCQLLEALSATDVRLGKAYGLGRALAETALVPADARAEVSEQEFGELLAEGRLITIRDWLFDLKTLLPDHAAYAVSRGLDGWQQWVAGRPSAVGYKSARAPIRVQGRIWRELLTGEKAARDMLELADYLTAGRQVAGRAAASLWHFKWLLTAAALVTAGVVITVLHWKGVSPSVRLVVVLSWIAGALGLSMKGAGALLGGALRDVEGWLWQSELDEAVAMAATCLPPGETPRRAPGDAVGAMPLSRDRTAELRRWDLMRDQAAGSAQAGSAQAASAPAGSASAGSAQAGSAQARSAEAGSAQAAAGTDATQQAAG